MDRRVKERLVGAAILGVLVVLIVPELLSGPKRAVVVPRATLPGVVEPIRSVTVDLATNKTTAGEAPGVDAPGGMGSGDATPGDATPGTMASTVNPETTEGEPAGAGRESADEAAGAAPPGATAPAAGMAQAQPPASPLLENGAASRSDQAAARPDAVHHGWVAQLGSFAARANAEKLERQLRAQGFSPFLSAAGSGKALRYRVRVGPVGDRTAAVKVAAKLQKAGHTASVIVP